VDQVDDDACVGLLALIAGIVSYLHMHMLVALHGQPGWVAVLTPLSVDGMIVAASSNARAQQASSASETRPMTAVVTKKRYWQSPRRDQRLVVGVVTWRGLLGLVSCQVTCHSDVSCRLDR